MSDEVETTDYDVPTPEEQAQEDEPDQTLPEIDYGHSVILVFGDVQDLIALRSDSAQGWIDNILEYNDGQHMANWYISSDGERLEGSGWDTTVRWGNPETPYDTVNSRYVMFLGAPDDWDEACETTAREIIERHSELYGSTRLGVHIDLDEASIRGRESTMRDWVKGGALPSEGKATREGEMEEEEESPDQELPLVEMIGEEESSS
jgi:hypothetical protein